MIFGKRKEGEGSGRDEGSPGGGSTGPASVIVTAPDSVSAGLAGLIGELTARHDSLSFPGVSLRQLSAAFTSNTLGVILVSPSAADLTAVYSTILEQRAQRKDLRPVLVIAIRSTELAAFGSWLQEEAAKERLSGVRLILFHEYSEIAAQLENKLEPIPGKSIIKMPVAPEVEGAGFKYFFLMSPELFAVASLMRELAENSIKRIYLLGGPGIGKTSLAYYYFLCRGKGNFVTINLNAESTGDKAAMKSLLCGHVSGAFPGSGSREGALSFARDGVCFLDESHGVTGTVMQVLMEALDSGQFLPYGATAKRFVECAVVFASNRKWEHLRSMIHLDEHARLGATLVHIPALTEREEDLITGAAIALAGFARQCATWGPPSGFSAEAWRLMMRCPWRGNTRTVMRVTEAAAISTASHRKPVIEESDVAEAIALWEPEEHPDIGAIIG